MASLGDVIELWDSRNKTVDIGDEKTDVRRYLVYHDQDNALETLSEVKGVFLYSIHPDTVRFPDHSCTHLDTIFAGAGGSSTALGGVFKTYVTAYFAKFPLDPYGVTDYFDFSPLTIIEYIDLDGKIIGPVDPETAAAEGTQVVSGGGTLRRTFRIHGVDEAKAKALAMINICNPPTVNASIFESFAAGLWRFDGFSVQPLPGNDRDFSLALVMGNSRIGPDNKPMGHRERRITWQIDADGEFAVKTDTVHKLYAEADFSILNP